jgi:hypothetical protein
MYAAIQLLGYICKQGSLVAPAIPVAVPAATTATPSAAVLPSTPTTSAPTLFGPVAALAVDRTVPTGFERHRCGLAATGTNHGCTRAHPAARAVTTLVLGMGWSMATTAATSTLFSLAAWFTTPGRGVAAFLEKLLFTSSENKFLTAVATS